MLASPPFLSTPNFLEDGEGEGVVFCCSPLSLSLFPPPPSHLAAPSLPPHYYGV